MKNSNKGFTLIELLVVIAIIGILSSVVLASLTTARTKGQDAAIQSQLSNMRAQAELYYSTNSNKYASSTLTGGSCSTGVANSLFSSSTTNNLAALLSGQVASATTDCGASDVAWSVAASLSGTKGFCVDSTGVAKNKNSLGVEYTGATTGATPAHASAGAVVCN